MFGVQRIYAIVERVDANILIVELDDKRGRRICAHYYYVQNGAQLKAILDDAEHLRTRDSAQQNRKCGKRVLDYVGKDETRCVSIQ